MQEPVFARQMEIRHIPYRRDRWYAVSYPVECSRVWMLACRTPHADQSANRTRFSSSPAIQRSSARSAPPHTLSPALATRDREFVSAWHDGGDAQPQILCRSQPACFSINSHPQKHHAARRALAGPTSGFDTWDDMSQQQVLPRSFAVDPAGTPYRLRSSHTATRGIQHLDMPTPLCVTSMACRAADPFDWVASWTLTVICDSQHEHRAHVGERPKKLCVLRCLTGTAP